MPALSFRKKINLLFIVSSLVSMLVCYLSVNYFVVREQERQVIDSVEAQLDLLGSSIGNEISNILLTADLIDTSSQSLSALQDLSGFIRIYRVIQGFVFTDVGTLEEGHDEAKNILDLLSSVNSLTVGDTHFVEDKPVLTVISPGSNNRGDLFLADLSIIQNLLVKAHTEGIYLTLVSPNKLPIYNNLPSGLSGAQPIEREVIVQGQSWILSGYINQSFIEDAVNALNQKIMLALGIVGIGTVVISILLAFHAYKPVLKLHIVTQELASDEGDLSSRLDVHSDDELGQIAANINCFVEKLSEMVKKVELGAHSVQSTSNALSCRAEKNQMVLAQHVKETDQVVLAMEQMSESSESVLLSSRSAAEKVNDAHRLTESGLSQIAVASDHVKLVVSDFEYASKEVERLNQDIEKIIVLLATIEGIADQTNLLALNAAIEAARAGEHGRGFAVVSDEVRALATQTRQSTDTIDSNLVQLQRSLKAVLGGFANLQSSNQKMVVSTEGCEKALEDIAISVKEISVFSDEMATSASKQRAVSQTIANSMGNIQAMAAEIEESGRHTANQVKELGNAENELSMVVQQFRS